MLPPSAGPQAPGVPRHPHGRQQAGAAADLKNNRPAPRPATGVPSRPAPDVTVRRARSPVLSESRMREIASRVR
jgi:hypothetical protein